MAGYLYFIKAIGTSFYKIGISNNPEARLRQLQTGSPLPIQLVTEIFCLSPQDREAELHAALAHYKANGEWFELSDKEARDLIRQEYSMASEEFWSQIHTLLPDGARDYVTDMFQLIIDATETGNFSSAIFIASSAIDSLSGKDDE